jgi:hypothetical protein
VLVHALHIAFDGLAALGHGAVEPGAHGTAAAQHVAAEAGRDLDGQRSSPLRMRRSRSA